MQTREQLLNHLQNLRCDQLQHLMDNPSPLNEREAVVLAGEIREAAKLEGDDTIHLYLANFNLH